MSTKRFVAFNSFTEYSGKLYAGINTYFGFLGSPTFFDNVLVYDTITGWDLNHRFDPGIYIRVVAANLTSYNGDLYAILLYTQNSPGRAVEMWKFDGATWTLTQTLDPQLSQDTESIVYSGNMYFPAIRTGVVDPNHYIYKSDGTNFLISQTIAKDSNLNAPPTLGVYAGNLYFAYSNVIYKFDGISWTTSNTFPSVDTSNLNGIYSLVAFNGLLYAIMTTNTTFDFGGPFGFAVLMDREVWIFNGVSWSLDSTVPATAFPNDPSYNTDICSDIYRGKMAVKDATRLLAVLTSNFNSHVDVFEYNTGSQTWSETSTDQTFDPTMTKNYFLLPSLFEYSVNSLLYLTLSANDGTDVWTFPIADL